MTTPQQLSKAIADSGKWVPRPGMACRDPLSGTVYRYAKVNLENPLTSPHPWRAERMADGSLCDPINDPTNYDTRTRLFRLSEAWKRAIAAGPDLTDDATIYALLPQIAEALTKVYGEPCDLYEAMWFLNAVACGHRQSEPWAAIIAEAWLCVHGPDAGSIVVAVINNLRRRDGVEVPT